MDEIFTENVMDDSQKPVAGPSKLRINGPSNGKQKNRKPLQKSRKMKAAAEAQAVEALEQLALAFEPPPGLSEFSDLPISTQTKRGLKKAFFVKMTDIQARSIPMSLKGKDVLGAARTGSGKTLSFLVPVLEILYRKKWGPQDGLGALVISPTRELAVQIFDVLKAIGGYHTFSAGLVIGGKNLKDERERLSRMNVLVATPGRLLQHMDQTFGFECDNLQILVLDEADRILDMGFQRTLNALLSHLPKSRQTLLFSATQTESVKDLARLSLREPVFVGVKEEGSSTATPKSLEQHYVVCELHRKLDILWSFIKSHLQSKILVFMSSGKQVRFVFETFCKLHPGMPLMHLHGKQKQATRLSTTSKFTSMKHAVLFATDIAARGLDFPAVDWVVQVDAPEDAETYIHRVGRTARYDSKGRALLFLLPSEEEGMLSCLNKKEISIEKIKIKDSKTHSIQTQLQNLAFQDPEIKYLGQRAFVSYMRSVYLHKDKTIFQIDKLPAEQFAASLGLPGAPKIKFLNKEFTRQRKNASHEVQNQDDGDSDRTGHDINQSASSDEESTNKAVSDGVSAEKKNPIKTKYDRMFGRKNQNILSEHYTKLVDHETDGATSDEDNFITLKRADHDLPAELPLSNSLSKRKLKMGTSRKAMLKTHGNGHKLVFDDDGNAHEVYELRAVEDEFKGKDVVQAGQEFAEGERGKLKEADLRDKQEAKDKKKEKKRKRKERERMERDGEAGGVQISADADADGYESPNFDYLDDGEGGKTQEPPLKRPRPHSMDKTREYDAHSHGNNSLEDEEELALRLLRRN